MWAAKRRALFGADANAGGVQRADDFASDAAGVIKNAGLRRGSGWRVFFRDR
jgi:hypothetical protein